MKKFTLKLALRLALLGAVGVLFIGLMPKRWYLGHEYFRWEVLYGRMEKGAESGAKNLILGDSRPEMGLDAVALGAENFGMGGSSPVEGYFFLRKMESRAIDTLYLSYAPFHLQSMDCFYTRTDYYNFVDKTYIDEVVALAEAKGDSAFLRHNWPWLDILERDFPWKPSRELVKYVPSIRSTKGYWWYFEEAEGMEKAFEADNYSFLLDQEACPRDSAAPEVALEKEFGAFGASPVNDHYFKALISLAQSRNIQLVWVNMPTSATTVQPSYSYFADFNSYLGTRLPKGTPVIPFTTYDHCAFRDFNHLDRQGAEKFTRAMKSLHKFQSP